VSAEDQPQHVPHVEPHREFLRVLRQVAAATDPAARDTGALRDFSLRLQASSLNGSVLLRFSASEKDRLTGKSALALL
jgi:hypothetical protein